VQNNGATPISAWRVAWTWAGNQQITDSWNAATAQARWLPRRT
jgi:cellulose 1,4-beta-cellobiosidase